MRISRLLAPAMLALTLAACSKDKDPTGLTPEQQRLEAAAKLQDLSVNVSDPEAQKAVKQAGVMLQLGAPVTEVSLTTTASAALRGDAAVNARVSADIGNATEVWSATALQVVLTNSATANGTYNVFVMWKGAEDLVFVGAPDDQTSATISTTGTAGFGGLFTAPNASWRATGGTVSITDNSVSTTCAVTTSITGLTCKDASFTGGFNITSSAPFTVSGTNTATGSRTAALTSRSVSGIQVTLDCSLYNC